MRTALVAVLGLSMLVGLAMAQVPTLTQQQPKPQFNTLQDKVSYIIGISMAGQLKQDGLADVDFNLMARGLQDGLAGHPAMTQEEMQQAMQEFEQKEIAAESAKNTKEGAEVMAANKNQPGVASLPSGIQYKVLKQGDGPTPQPTDTVTAHYKGTLLNGQVFDSSYQRGQPMTIGLDQGLIKGWVEVLQKMKVGDKWQVWIPPELAYGVQGFPPAIGANATLVFEIELLGTAPKQQ